MTVQRLPRDGAGSRSRRLLAPIHLFDVMALSLLLLSLQGVLPLALLLWLWRWPSGSRLGCAVQFVAVALVLLWLAATGLWTVPPWWALWLYAAMLAAVGWRGLRRRHEGPSTPRPSKPQSGLAWLAVAGFAGLAIVAAHEASFAWAGRRTPAAALHALQFPLTGGTYLVVNGGDDIRINAHLKTRDAAEPRFARWRGNGYGVDLVAIDRFGLRAGGLQPTNNLAYRIFGRPVLSPCAGTVVLALDGRPDMTPPQVDSREHLAGNHVVLACGNVHVVLAHLRQNTVRVRPGDVVRAGQTLGEVGNSGISDEAHLHVHVQRPGTAQAPLGGEPLPATFFGRFLLRGDRLAVGADGRLR